VFWIYHLPFGVQKLSTEQLTRRKLTIDDVMAIRGLPHVVAADGRAVYAKAFYVGGISAKYEGHKVSGTILEGHTSQVAIVSELNLKEGRFFTDGEDQRHADVCVLGHDTAEQLFVNGEDPIGKDINVETGLYTVIGVLDKRKQPFGSGTNPNDNAIFFPMGTFHNLHPEVTDMFISAKYDDPKNKALVEDEIRELLRIRRKVKVEADDNFEIFSPDGLLKLWGNITGGLVAFMIAVSSVGLMVGGVGVMNIMLVSVTERTREIGIRKAIGATKQTILTQFTTEAITLCAVGGIIGVLVGAVLTWIVYLLPIGLPATLSTLWVLVGFGVSCTIGLVFGIYPAWKAANLDPIEALRYE
jgi:putative ABC transport system permease protein